MNRISHKRFQGVCLILWVALSLPSTELCSKADMFHSERNPEKYGDTGLEDIQKRFAGRNSLLATHAASPLQPSPDFSLKRTDSALVGSIMALLATFEAADVLPPEDSSQANQLIHGLIQLQSALVKSQKSRVKGISFSGDCPPI